MPTNTNNSADNAGVRAKQPRKPRAKKTKKNKLFAHVSTTGKAISWILGLAVAAYTCWTMYKSMSTKNIAGKWKLKFVVEKCNHTAFIGESHTQITMFSQLDKAIEGKGEKWEYNGKPLDFDMHRKIEYKGNIEGNKLEAMYVLHGLERDSEGHISVVISDDGKTLTGTYSGTIGNDSGPVTGERMD
ncbi:MAG TPA: hypothetical protein VKG26_13740 [Bacteroidia bacterium]|nr:hypothetical protein [Bacteroidia bacterium]